MAVKYVRSDADGSGDGTTTANSGATGAWTLAQAIAATPAAGDEIRIMATGTYTRSATATIAWANGTGAANILLTGANGSSGAVDGTFATIQASAGSITLLSVTGGNITVQYLEADGNSQTTTTGIYFNTSYARGRFLKAKNTTSYGIRVSAANGTWIYQCTATGCSGTAAFDVARNALWCEAYDNTCSGFLLDGIAMVAGCVADSNTGSTSRHGFVVNSVGSRIINCVAYGNGGDGFNCDGNASLGTHIQNCIAYANGAEGFGTDGVKSGLWLYNCAGGNNTSGNYNATNITNVTGFQALTGDPFTDAANGDFTLNNTSGAGAACRAAGFPGVLLRGVGTGYADIGVYQHQDSGGGGGPFVWQLKPNG